MQQKVQQVVLEEQVPGQRAVLGAEHERVVQREEAPGVARHQRVEDVARQQGCLGDRAVAGLQHQPRIVHAGLAGADGLRVQIQPAAGVGLVDYRGSCSTS